MIIKDMPDENQFSFNISLSVLNHLGRNLYRSFVTILGEAISNAWDADAHNVWIYIDRENNSLFVKDDGIGMTRDDFQGKFLKIGYSKRREGQTSSPLGRPYIGRKGIGKLALLSCAEKIHVISKTEGEEYIGGVIDNSGLDQAITDDLTAQEYGLGEVSLGTFEGRTDGHTHGTIIYFEGIKDGVRNSFTFLKKAIALYFRFSLLDTSFKVYLENEEITVDCLQELIDKTEFLWEIGDYTDPYLVKLKSRFTPDKNEQKRVNIQNAHGFIASVEKPRDLKVMTTEERVGVDLFVNGRLRERDILKHIPTARVAESYLYGQIHLNYLDDEVDRFTSSRESIVADDQKYKEFLDVFRRKILEIVGDWDKWRIKHREDGDPENDEVPKRDRKSRELFNAVAQDYDLPSGDENKQKVNGWVNNLADDAQYNFASYAECFISENLIRKLIQENKVALSTEANREISRFKVKETNNKTAGNVNIDIRKNNVDTSYLDMDGLAHLVDNAGTQNCLPNDSKPYKPIRDALMHTALLTDEAKVMLTSIYNNIKGRVKTLLSTPQT